MHPQRGLNWFLLLLCSLALPLLGNSAVAGTRQSHSLGRQPAIMTRSSAPIASATPDAFGYVLDDAVAFDWVDASTGTPSGLVGDDAFLGPTDIGFGFHFYEESYDTLYISTNGILSFGSGQAAYLNTSIPFPARPNAMVAALWADLCVRDGCNSGAVYYLRGGAAPNRFLVVEWHQISFQGDATPLTFEAILQENGDIVLQYSDLPAPLGTVTVGIEDASGQDGLQFASSRLASGSAIRFRRPSPSARVQVAPAYQSRFVHASQQASFALTIRNTGELGADTFDLEVSSVWSASLADAQGVALPDTNANGLPDTGPVPAGSAVNAVLMLTVPDSAARGDANSAMLDVHSSREPTRHKTVQLDACVPAGLAQILLDGSQDNIAVLLAQPWAVALQQLCPPGRGAESPAIAESANGDLVCVWSRGRWNATAYTFEIEYAFLTPGSSSTPSVRKLVDNSQAPGETWDKQPVLAATSHAQTAVAWVRKAFDSQFRESDNLYFALLNASGSLVRAPTNLTNNNSWGTWGDAGFADLSEPSIVALNDRFALAWQRETFVNEETVTDVFYALCQPTGGVVGGIQRLTSDTPGSDDGNSRPNLTAISGDRVLITWTRHADGEVYYAMLSNSGSVVRPAERLTADGLAMIDHDTDACELPDGHIVIAWEGGQSIRFAVLDSNFNRLVAPTSLQNPAAAFGSDSVSVVAAGNDAVLTWKDTGESYAPRLYYALVGRDGRVITPPQGFYSSSGSVVQTNSSGYGNTTYHAPSPTATQTSTVTPSPTTTRTSTATPTPTHTRALTPSPVRTETRPATPVRRTVYLPSILKPSALAH